MSRLLIHVEGETEETFVNEVLSPHLVSFGYQSVSARLIGNARQTGSPGRHSSLECCAQRYRPPSEGRRG